MFWSTPTPAASANQGAAGVDGERFEDIEAYGVERWLGELAEELREKTYRPQAAQTGVHSEAERRSCGPWRFPRSATGRCRWRRCWSWSPSSKPTCRRSNMGIGRSAVRWTAVQEQVHSLLITGHTQVVDADLTEYFDSIPHAELMTSVARRVVDRHDAASDQDVARGTGGGDGRAGTEAAHDPEQGRVNGVSLKAHRSHRC